MFLLTVKKKFIKELTVIGIVLTTLVAVVYHLFIPDRYFLWFPAIPIFFYLQCHAADVLRICDRT